MEERIYGVEREFMFFPEHSYSITLQDVGALVDNLRPRTRGGKEVLPPEIQFIVHGGRFYRDSGSHREISTPECRRVRDLVIWDKAGERILETITRSFPESVREKAARLGGCTFLKNNTGLHQEIATNAMAEGANLRVFPSSKILASWGSHFCIMFNRRETHWDDVEKIIAPFCFTSGFFTGAGLVWVTNEDRFSYSFSQRLPFVFTLHDTSATANDKTIKPMFLVRDRPYADKGLYYRAEISGLDSTMCEWPLYVFCGIIGILFRMAEERVLTPSRYCRNQKTFESDLFLTKQSIMWLGSERHSFLFQEKVFTVASLHRELYAEPISAYRAFCRRNGRYWSEEDEDVFQKYDFFVKTLEQSESSYALAEALAPYADWAAKLHHLILPDMRRLGYSFATRPDAVVHRNKRNREVRAWDRLKYIDNFFHDVRRESGLYYRLLKCGLIEKIASDAEVDYAKEHPPSDTRAHGRDRRFQDIYLNQKGTFLTGASNLWHKIIYNFLEYGPLCQFSEENLNPFDADPAAFRRR